MTKLVLAKTVAALTLASTSAAAAPSDEGPSPPTREAGTRAPFALDGWLGVGARYEESSTSALGSAAATVVYRPSLLSLGATVEHDGEINPLGLDSDQATHQFVGALAGPTLALTKWFAIETLAELGAHMKSSGDAYHVPETDEVVSDETATVVPYAGLRVAPTFTFAPVRLGPWLLAREDIGRATTHYTSTDCSSGDCVSSRGSHDAGGLQLTAGLRAGIEFGAL